MIFNANQSLAEEATRRFIVDNRLTHTYCQLRFEMNFSSINLLLVLGKNVYLRLMSIIAEWEIKEAPLFS